MECVGCIDHPCEIQGMGSIAINECPCKECIIKMMCGAPCDPFKKHMRSIFPDNTKIFFPKLEIERK